MWRGRRTRWLSQRQTDRAGGSSCEQWGPCRSGGTHPYPKGWQLPPSIGPAGAWITGTLRRAVFYGVMKQPSMRISGSGDTRVTKKGMKKSRIEVRHGAQIHQNASCILAK